jgi:hypothetical protein
VFIPISDFLREIAPLRVVEYTRNCLLQQERRAFLFLLKSCARQKMLGALRFKSCELLASTPQVQFEKSVLRLRRAQSVLMFASILPPGLGNANVSAEDNQSYWRN